MLRRLSRKPAKPTVDESAITSLFEKYADPDDPEVVAIDGIGDIAEQIELDPGSDVRVLVLCWRLCSKALSSKHY